MNAYRTNARPPDPPPTLIAKCWCGATMTRHQYEMALRLPHHNAIDHANTLIERLTRFIMKVPFYVMWIELPIAIGLWW